MLASEAGCSWTAWLQLLAVPVSLYVSWRIFSTGKRHAAAEFWRKRIGDRCDGAVALIEETAENAAEYLQLGCPSREGREGHEMESREFMIMSRLGRIRAALKEIRLDCLRDPRTKKAWGSSINDRFAEFKTSVTKAPFRGVFEKLFHDDPRLVDLASRQQALCQLLNRVVRGSSSPG